MDRNDYYRLLGVTPRASAAEIRRAFRRLARKYHPDVNPGDNVAAIRYQRIYEAFEVLSDPEQRKQYDRAGSSPRESDEPEPARYGFEGFDFSLEDPRPSDIFPELFGRPARGRPAEREDGEDVHHRLRISFEESLKGVRTAFRISRYLACATCEGWGEIPASESRPCPACRGRGRATQSRGFMIFAKPCPRCGGEGRVTREPCPDCQGVGRAPEQRTVKVDIPAGVSDGDKVSVPGMGNQGRGSGRTGDLYVHVQVHPHAFFFRKGDNLYGTVPITFTEAALGARIGVPTPDGPVTLRVPAGVQSGQKLRLSERGAPSRLGAGRGDLFIVVQVVTPKIYDDRSRELLRELDRRNPMRPREGIEGFSERGQEVSR